MKPYQRQQLLAEFRGYREPRKTRESVSLKDATDAVMNKLGLEDRLAEQEITGAWRGIVGDFLAEHSHPLRLKHKVLHVRVLQPSVHYELDRKWKPEVLSKLQERFGKSTIRDVKFGLG